MILFNRFNLDEKFKNCEKEPFQDFENTVNAPLLSL